MKQLNSGAEREGPSVRNTEGLEPGRQAGFGGQSHLTDILALGSKGQEGGLELRPASSSAPVNGHGEARVAFLSSQGSKWPGRYPVRR